MENEKVMSGQLGSSTGGASPIHVSPSVANTASIPKCYPETVWDFTECVRRYLSEQRDAPSSARLVNSRLQAHEDGKCYSEINGTRPVFALLSHDDISWLEGRLLTIVDATFGDREQRRAFKNLVRNTIWFDWVPKLDADGTGGKPDLDRE